GEPPAGAGGVPPAGASVRGLTGAALMAAHEAAVAGSEERRTVVVAGHGAGAHAEAFARAHRLPLLAEPSSNARFGPNAIGPYRMLLAQLGPAVERVVVFGRPTLSRPVAALLAREEVPAALFMPEPVAWFEPGRRRERLIEEPAELSIFSGVGPAGWLEQWQEAAAAADAAAGTVLAAEPGLTGLHVGRAVWQHTAGRLVLGSSNPIRDVDLLGAPAAKPAAFVHANRGLAGIDGTVSTAAGLALAVGTPTRALLGDLTFLHDVGGLFLGAGEEEPPLQLVVVNDAGGGIFTLLEHGKVGLEAKYTSAVERLFGTPHEIDLAALAMAYAIPYHRVEDDPSLEAALKQPVARRSLLEVRTDRSRLRGLHARIAAAVAAAVAPVRQQA
ncbi:2-succinyl-6-hydroxy-2,4-cyclohexadiene-1-carboxylate synthase, partial [Arthrobacter crystallopoietes BAB-32]